ncbi:BA75_01226T0 [Komagataella pastoris]|uniref:BA75_01226T0 n=1 Tax=Komagataella pastoris TaxID=4922 RepID=A0A1B2J675_PICPA|nr:BA75_01226T0 [Komagataella pastoris]
MDTPLVGSSKDLFFNTVSGYPSMASDFSSDFGTDSKISLSIVDLNPHSPPVLVNAEEYLKISKLRQKVIDRQATRLFPLDDWFISGMEERLIRWRPPQSQATDIAKHPYFSMISEQGKLTTGEVDAPEIQDLQQPSYPSTMNTRDLVRNCQLQGSVSPLSAMRTSGSIYTAQELAVLQKLEEAAHPSPQVSPWAWLTNYVYYIFCCNGILLEDETDYDYYFEGVTNESS